MKLNDTVLYIQMIDEIRKQKQIPLESFISDITSERSYRRYLNQELSPPLDTLEQLINRLGVDFADILVYTLTVKKTPSGIIELITYVHFDELELAKTYYEQLLNYNNAHKELLMLVDAYLRYYEYKTYMIDDASFIRHLKSLASYYETHPFDSNEALALIILYDRYVPHQTQFKHQDIQTLLLEKDLHLIQILLYDVMADQYLHSLLKKDTLNVDTYITLAKHITDVTLMWYDAIYIYAGHFHRAMIHHYQNEPQQRDLYFMKYVSYRSILLKEAKKSDHDQRIEAIINMDIQTFQQRMFDTLLLNEKT